MSPKVASVASALELADKFPSSVRLSSSSTYGPWSSVLQRTFDDVRITSHANSASVWATVFAPQRDGSPAPNNSDNAQRFAITLLELTVDAVNRSLITQAQTAPNPALAAWGLLQQHHQSNMAANKTRLAQEIQTVKFDNFRKDSLTERDTVTKYMGFLVKKRAELISSGGAMSEETLLHYARANLPQAYQPQLSFINGWTPQDCTIPKFQAALFNASSFVSTVGHSRVIHPEERGPGALLVQDRVQPKKPKDSSRGGICHYFLKGKCSRTDCRYHHISAERVTKAYEFLQGHGNHANYASDRNQALSVCDRGLTVHNGRVIRRHDGLL
jgi:hypothetical protein